MHIIIIPIYYYYKRGNVKFKITSLPCYILYIPMAHHYIVYNSIYLYILSIPTHVIGLAQRMWNFYDSMYNTREIRNITGTDAEACSFFLW